MAQWLCVCMAQCVCVRDEQGGVSRGVGEMGAPQHTKRHNNGVTMRARWHQPCNTPTTAPQPSRSTGVEGHGAPHQLVGCVAAGVVWVLWHEPPGFVSVVGVAVNPPHNTTHHLLGGGGGARHGGPSVVCKQVDHVCAHLVVCHQRGVVPRRCHHANRPRVVLRTSTTPRAASLPWYRPPPQLLPHQQTPSR